MIPIEKDRINKWEMVHDLTCFKYSDEVSSYKVREEMLRRGAIGDHGFNLISLSDTIGSATPSIIEKVYQYFSLKYPEVEFGLHLHTNPKFWRDKIDASFDSRCNRIDGAIQGFGGCPMASDNLIGNMPTEKIISYCKEKAIETSINPLKFEAAYNYASDIFLNYH